LTYTPVGTGRGQHNTDFGNKYPGMTLDCSSDRLMFESTVRSLGLLLVGSSHKEETETI